MRIIFLLIVMMALGYFIFSDKKVMVESIKKRLFDLDLPTVVVPENKLQDMSPSSAPDYSDEDRKHLDFILEDNQPVHP